MKVKFFVWFSMIRSYSVYITKVWLNNTQKAGSSFSFPFSTVAPWSIVSLFCVVGIIAVTFTAFLSKLKMRNFEYALSASFLVDQQHWQKPCRPNKYQLSVSNHPFFLICCMSKEQFSNSLGSCVLGWIDRRERVRWERNKNKEK